MLRSNFVWRVLCLTAVCAVPLSVAAQEQSNASAVWIELLPTEVNLGALLQGPSNTSGVWIDLGFPVQERPDGSRVKPLFEPLMTDLDGAIRQFESGPRAVWIPKAFFDKAPVFQMERKSYEKPGFVGKDRSPLRIVGPWGEEILIDFPPKFGPPILPIKPEWQPIIAFEPKQRDSKVIETIRIEGGKVEIVGDSIKVEGGKVEIIRETPRP